MINPLREHRVDLVANQAAAGASDPFTEAIDMANYDQIELVAIVSSAGATDTFSLKAMGATSSTATSTSKGFSKLHATAATVSSSKSEEHGLLRLQIIRPQKRYVGAKVIKGNTVVLGGVVAIRSGPRMVSSTKTSTSDLAAPKLFMPNTTGSTST